VSCSGFGVASRNFKGVRQHLRGYLHANEGPCVVAFVAQQRLFWIEYNCITFDSSAKGNGKGKSYGKESITI